jgi:sugar lactone lactonase YvrE
MATPDRDRETHPLSIPVSHAVDKTPIRRGRRTRRPGEFASRFRLRPRVGLLEQRALLTALSTLTALRASTASAPVGQSVSFIATVSDQTDGGDVPNGGRVTFSDQGGAIGSGTLVNGVAEFTTSSLAAGTFKVTASYGGTASFAASTTGTIVTVAGTGPAGYTGDNGPATAAELNDARVAVDSAGNLFIADGGNNRIREVVKATGDIITVAGNGTAGYSGDNGPATAAEIDGPNSVAVDSAGNLFISDEGNNRIREVVKATGDIITVAGDSTAGYSGDGGPATAAVIDDPRGISGDSAGDVFFADAGNNRIREVVEASGDIITVAGDGTAGYSGDGGPATAAELNGPLFASVDSSGDLFIGDSSNNRIREVVKASGKIITVAGDGTAGYSGDNGPATAAELNYPNGVDVDSAGDLFIGDENNNRIREVVKATGDIITVAGNGTAGYSGDNGPATAAELSIPGRIAIDSAGDLFISSPVSSTVDNVIREVTPGVTITIGPSTQLTTVIVLRSTITTVGLGQSITFIATITDLSDGGSVANGGTVTFSDQNGVLGYGTVVDGEATFTISTLALGTFTVSASYGGSTDYALSTSGTIVTVVGDGAAGYEGDGGPASASELDEPVGMCLDAEGDLFTADFGNNVVREVVKATGDIITVAGNGIAGYSGDGGPATAAELNGPNDVLVDASGNLFISDYFSNRIREVFKATGVIITVAGNGTAGFSGNNGPATAAELFNPHGLAIDAAGDLFLADSINAEIREVVKATGDIIAAAGDGTSGYGGDGGLATSAELDYPIDVALDPAGDLFISDFFNDRIREVVKATGDIITVAGNGTAGFSGDGGPATSAELDHPVGIALDSAGDLFIADNGNDRVREVVEATGDIVTVAGSGAIGYSGDGGPAISAELDNPQRLVVDPEGDLFISDSYNNVIREVTQSVTVTISTTARLTPIISWPDPLAIIYGTAIGGTQLDATASYGGSTVAGTFYYSVESGTILEAGILTLFVTFEPTDTVDYQPVSTQITLVVDPLRPTITWPNPAAITTGTALGAIQLDATASVPGTFTYSPAAGTVLSGGLSQTLSVTFTPLDATDYAIATDTVSINVLIVTSTSVSVSSLSAPLHHPLTLTATVSAPAGSPIPVGSVTFFDGTTPIGSGMLNASGKVSLVVSTLGLGQHAITATYAGNASDLTSRATAVPIRVGDAVSGDYDGDGKSDIAVFDQTTATFEILYSGGGSRIQQLGNPADKLIPVAGDYDGDGKTDLAIYDQTLAEFFILYSNGGSLALPFGNPHDVNIPVVGDYDGLGKTDIAIYDQTAAVFYILYSNGGSLALQFGNSHDVNIPVAGDFDGDGKTDIAIYDQTAATFLIEYSGGGTRVQQLGNKNHVNVPIATDFSGSGKTDLTIYDQTAGVLYSLEPNGGTIAQPFGNPADNNIPLAGDYFGDGKTDIGIYDATATVYFILDPGGSSLILQFGNNKHANQPV